MLLRWSAHILVMLHKLLKYFFFAQHHFVVVYKTGLLAFLCTYRIKKNT